MWFLLGLLAIAPALQKRGYRKTPRLVSLRFAGEGPDPSGGTPVIPVLGGAVQREGELVKK